MTAQDKIRRGYLISIREAGHASLYRVCYVPLSYKNRWNLHYLSAEQKAVASIREAESKPLTKASFKRALEEMKANAQ